MEGQKETETLKRLHLNPGDKVQVTTKNSTVYEIDVGDVAKGLLNSRVHRQPMEPKDDLALPEMTIEQASVFVAKAPYVGAVALGDRVEIIGIESKTQEWVSLHTSPVVALSHVEEGS